MALTLLFFLGIANFALHKGVLESGHPLLVHLPSLLRGRGGVFSFTVEFLLLAGTMLLVAQGNSGGVLGGWVAGYAAYSAVNALSAWLIISGRV